jgi:uncharacterized protein YbcI
LSTTTSARSWPRRHDLINGVETILGRTVVAFMSDNHIDPDIAVEVFLLGADAGSQSDGACGAASML